MAILSLLFLCPFKLLLGFLSQVLDDLGHSREGIPEHWASFEGSIGIFTC